MTTPKPAVRPSTDHSTSTERGFQAPPSWPSEDSSIDEQPPKARSNNILTTQRTRTRSVAPIRSLSTRAAPRLPSIASLQSTQDQTQSLRTPPLNSKASYTIRASIAKLELLLHEATRLAENAIWHEQENRIEEEPAPQAKSVEPNHYKSDLVRLKETAPTTLSRRSPALNSFNTARPSIKSVTSSPTVKAALAEPILTLPSSKSTEDVEWTPSRPVWVDHETRQDDILEHLQDATCPESRQGLNESFETEPSIEERPETPPQSSPLQSKDTAQPLTVHSTEHPAIGTKKRLRESPTNAVEESPSGGGNEPPAFQFTVQDVDEHDVIDFAAACRPHRVMTGLSVSTSRGPLNQSTITLDPLAGGGLKRTRTGKQSSEVLEMIRSQPTATIDPSKGGSLHRVRTGHERHYSNLFGLPSRQVSMTLNRTEENSKPPEIDLTRKSHVDVYHEGETFNVYDTCHHATIARHWPTSRKRFTAAIACINTGCIGLLIGIYAGEVPAIQYAIADFHHYSILGNVFLYIGLAISGFVFWPLPLLHGRKPYTIAALLLALVLQVPQGLAVAGYRNPNVPMWRCLLLVSRAISGFALGFSDMNHKAMLLDCFGASLQSQGDDPLDIYDARKHGGGMGMWLGVVSWSTVGPISIGFLVGAAVISHGASVSWGFWTSLCILLVVLLLNVIAPEVRRAAFRRTVAEMIGEGGKFSRVTRGEIMMHLTATGPY